METMNRNSINKVSVVISADGGEAVGTIRNVEREMVQLERKAKGVQREVSQARVGSRNLGASIDNLLSRAQAKGLLKGDFRGALKSRFAETRMGGSAAVGLAVAVGLGKAGEAGSAFLEAVDEGTSLKAVAKRAGGDALAAIVEGNPLNPFGKFLYQLANRRLGARTAGEIFDTALNLTVSDLRGVPSEVDQAIEAQRQQRRAFMRWQSEQLRQARREEDARARSFQQIDEAVADRIRGLQVLSLPTKLPPAILRRIEQERELREKLRGDVLKKRLPVGVGS